MTTWTVSPQPVGSPESAALLREYLVDVADRWYLLYEGRRCAPEEIERHLAEMRSEDPGVLLVARYGGEPAGCVGVRRLDARTAEVCRMFVRADRRGLGGSGALLGAAEDVARAWGAARIVLETRRDLVEARALYARHGFGDVAPYKEGDVYSEVWLGKELTGA
ncbi:GNAT family N-acetyltransferase [Streptomyces sp. UNOB3_S3]|uniref:GNAT family N-acetyltransferase n=1 Tax=Streptomyces sp. UNOB3_S3 TaxID=2871682 RepID=UPI001E3EA87B|nr:GNAT family N-acetyltransferase [Streptomyces sp. UNOB3_S3]MCC3779300.1 GNAT family N-acetyltransferase [Streptomyces sp. UNOB3_S3]